MNVTVVICAYTLDRWEDIQRAVESCRAQTRPPEEVLVVVDHNDALLARAGAELPGCTVVANRSTRGLSGARNTGVATSSGDVLVFLDDDAYAEPTWLAELVAPLDDPAVAGVGGWVDPEWPDAVPPWFPETFYWVVGCSYRGLPADGATIRNPIGASMAIRRRVFDEVGGFTSGLGRIGRNPLGCEETELCIRYGTAHPDDRFVLARGAVVHHRVPPSRLTWHYFWTRCWAEGLSKAAVATLVGSDQGLSAERRHAARAIPHEIVTSLSGIRDAPAASVRRAALCLAGSVLAAAGVARGALALRRAPIARAEEGPNALDALRRDTGNPRSPGTR